MISNSYKIAIAFALLSLPMPLLAQAKQCAIPQNLPDAKIEYPPNDKARRSTPVTNYLLSLSWSPEYCKSKGKSNETQCRGEAGRFGFVLHGLWPETDGSDYPQWCAPAKPLSRAVVRDNFCMTPSVDLLQHEWAKHGTCMTSDPERYFKPARIMYNVMRYPDMARMSRDRNLTVGTFRLNFARSNPGIRPEMIRVLKSKDNWLKEVHVCLNKDFRPQRCPSHVSMPSDRSKIKIWRGS